MLTFGFLLSLLSILAIWALIRLRMSFMTRPNTRLMWSLIEFSFLRSWTQCYLRAKLDLTTDHWCICPTVVISMHKTANGIWWLLYCPDPVRLAVERTFHPEFPLIVHELHFTCLSEPVPSRRTDAIFYKLLEGFVDKYSAT
jgi:hypothetical protein